jgi:tetratricopeptide (TPR) repeat protein
MEAEINYAKAIIKAQEVRDRNGEAIALMNIAGLYSKLGQYSLSIDLYTQALEAFQEIGALNDKARVFNNLGIAYRSLRQYSNSIDALSQSLEVSQVIGDRNSAAKALNKSKSWFSNFSSTGTTDFFIRMIDCNLQFHNFY